MSVLRIRISFVHLEIVKLKRDSNISFVNSIKTRTVWTEWSKIIFEISISLTYIGDGMFISHIKTTITNVFVYAIQYKI